MLKFQRHPLSAAFGNPTEDEFAALKASILKNGVIDPICLYEGMVLDGWNRYLICEGEGLPYNTIKLPEQMDPRDYVVAKNADRRHLTPGAKALAIAEVYKWQPAHRPRQADKSAESADLFEAPRTSQELADKAGVSVRTLEQAKQVVRKAAPEVKEAVMSGDITINKAAQLATLPKSEQVPAMIDPLVMKEAMEPPEPAKKRSAPEPEAADGDSLLTLHARIAELEDQLAQKVAEIAELHEKNDQVAAMMEEMHADLMAATKVLDGNDKVKEAMAEAKRYRDAHRAAEDRIRGLQTEKNEAVRMAKSWRAKAESSSTRARN